MRTTTLWVLVVLAAGAGCASSQGKDGPPGSASPRNVIYVIGDGLGFSQLTLGHHAVGSAFAPLTMPVAGFAATGPVGEVVTDSAAAGTALACGVKTHNKKIGLDPQGNRLVSLAAAARRKGLAVGIVTNTRITHATPAVFYAHQPHRSAERSIARQLAGSGFDLVLGGGRRFFPRPLLADFRARGYEIVTSPKGLQTPAKRLLGLFASSHLPYRIDRKEGDATLPSMAAAALRLLGSRRQGFFLTIEAGRIDHACHVQDAAALYHQMHELHETVAEVLQFARARADTLVVLTADHATGNLGISEKADYARLRGVKASADVMTRRILGGVEAREVLAALGGVKDLSAREAAAIEGSRPNPFAAATAIGTIVSRRSGIAFYDLDDRLRLERTNGHDGAFVPVLAFGPGSPVFGGFQHNHQIALRIARLLGVRIGLLGATKNQ